jgi:glycosyltransferase involved in cell wall biosynthesis
MFFAYFYGLLSIFGIRKWKRLAQYYRALSLPKEAVHHWQYHAPDPQAPVDVSVLITCFNYNNYVEKAIESVVQAAKHAPPIEMIIIDDHSTDGSLTVIQNAAKKTNIPTHILQTDWNVGVSHARNLALHRARGEYVLILDADNTIYSDALNNLYQRAKKEMADAAYGPIQRIHPDGSLDSTLSHQPFNPRVLIEEGNYIDAMALIRRESLLDIGGYDIHLLRLIAGWEDYAVWLEFAARGFHVAFDPEPIGTYLIKSDSMLRKISSKEIQLTSAFLKTRYLSSIQEQWP